MSSKGILAILPAVITLAACATMPPVTTSYYFPRAETNLSVLQTIGCNTAGVIGTSFQVTPMTSYSSDPDIPQGKIAFGDYGGTLTDADLTVSLTDDGRLSGINGTTAGQAGPILKNAISMVTSAAALTMALTQEDRAATKSQTDAICKVIADLNAKPTDGKAEAAKPSVNTVSITYAISLRFSGDGAKIYPDPEDSPEYPLLDDGGVGIKQVNEVDLIPDYASRPVYWQLSALNSEAVKSLLGIKVWSFDPTPMSDRAAWMDGEKQVEWRGSLDSPKGFVPLELNRSAVAHIAFSGPGRGLKPDAVFWRAGIPVPTNRHFALLVPTGRPFGKQAFQLALSPFGAITKLEYSTNTGAADAFDVAGTAMKALPTDASEAANDQAKADRIYEQQRLLSCHLDPKTCAK